jgi:hypothetical protein
MRFVVFNNSSSARSWRASDLAIQRCVGILPFERLGPGADYCLDPDSDGAALVEPRRNLFRL